MEQGSLVIEELTQGMRKAIELKAHMGPDVSGKTEGMLMEGILSHIETALLILNRGGPIEQYQSQSQSQCQVHVVPSSSMPGSPLSVIESPKSKDLNPGFSRKRKAMPTWTEQAMAKTESSGDGVPDDGHSWRKYGQKDILGAKYPRSYYRCTYRDLQGCNANKQVQRNDEDPSVFDITYKGTHTCTPTPRSKSKHPSSSVKHEHNTQYFNNNNNNNNNTIFIEYDEQHPDVTLNFQSGLTIDLANIEDQQFSLPLTPGGGLGFENHTLTPTAVEDYNFSSSFQASFVPSPVTTSGSNHFSTEIISATTSVTNSPVVGIDFPLEQWEFNPSFPYDNPGFFTGFSDLKD